MEPQRAIMVAVDESEESMNALKWCLQNIFRLNNDKLILVHAQRNPTSHLVAGGPGFVLTPNVIQRLESDMKKATQEVFAKAVEICKSIKVVPETVAVTGDARDVLTDAVKKYNPEMLVVGSHGYGRIKRTFLGSVSDYCTHHVTCPVVVVKPVAKVA
eukprot:TRINITY_DN11549_c0_g1_i1.p1 TRINITY_DN11549_c0_g1~~TRINITY_DN11549_c0_g1_i1.p1  ORF type:complete len:158 (-),score=27.77 TRINITY_DN11549_c0_g1_i1:189-662(-)